MYRRKLIVLISLIGVGFGFFFVFRFYKVFFWNNTQFENDYSFLFIDRDDTIDSLSLQLNPLLKSTKHFLLAAEKKGYTQRVLPGKYRLEKGMGNNEIINALRSKRLTTRVIFNNQERLEDLAGRVSVQIEADSLELLHAFKDSLFLAEAGFDKENALAMYLPNTYDLFWHSTPEDFRNRMLDYYQLFWNDERRKQAKKLNLSPIEVNILASIVQKESVQKEEQNRIAGVYINRLRNRIKLQADPTIIYALKKEADDFSKQVKRVLYKDLKIKSPYNTYRNRGLPPGPIVMSDLSAIEAVLNPEKHNYIYFVASPKKPGFHLFASSLRQHNKNKRVYTRWLDQQKLYR